MPFESEQQRKAMYAAQAGHSNIGIPQEVAEKFIKHSVDEIPAEPTVLSTPEFKEDGLLQKVTDLNENDAMGDVPEAMDIKPIDKMAGPQGRASGIMFLTNEGETLLMRRGDGGDYPNMFCVPGGHQSPDESLEECARRECKEETGMDYKGKLELCHDDGQFATYLAKDVEKFDVELSAESTGYVWCRPEESPRPLHPGLAVTFRIAGAKTETDIAQLMCEGVMPSPQMYANVCLLAIRITGTGLAYRSSIGENVWRDPSLYLNDEFLKRCNGLTVIMDHPETSVLTSEEFKNRAVGSIMLPYLKGDEVWGIAKVYDQDAVDEILEGEISTSPSVVFDNTAGNITLTTENGEPLLIEGVPFLLDHIAIVTKARGSKGVWDKGGDATGVLLNNQVEVSDMNDNTIAPKADSQGDKLDAILNAISGLAVRVDEMEKNLPAPPLVTATDRKDEEVETKKDEEEKKEEVEVKKDGGEIEMPAGEIKFDEDKEEEEACKADEEAAEYADAQAKADSVLSSFGKSASRPLQGESLMSYRKRLLRGLQAYSDAYKTINLNAIKDSQILAIAERTIFADALVAAKSPTSYANDSLIEINERDRSGRTITKFKGPMEAWLGDFKVPPMRVKEFHLHNNKR